MIDASRVSRCLSTASALCSSRYASHSRHCFNKRIALRPTCCFMQQGASRSYSQHSLTQHRLHRSQYRSSLRGSARGPWSFRSFLFRCAIHDCGTTGDPASSVSGQPSFASLASLSPPSLAPPTLSLETTVMFALACVLLAAIPLGASWLFPQPEHRLIRDSASSNSFGCASTRHALFERLCRKAHSPSDKLDPRLPVEASVWQRRSGA